MTSTSLLARASALVFLGAPALAAGQQTGSNRWGPQVLGTQINVIAQRLAPFRSAYEGPNSLTSRGDRQLSDIYGLYLGQRVSGTLHAYLDIEMARGAGVSHATGLGGVTNGDVIRQGSGDLGEGPYVARAYLRWTIALPGARRDTLGRAPDQMADVEPAHRLEIQGGKFALSDIFDVNRYANTTRLQFMDWGLFQNTAWDFAADTRGYSNGVALAWISRHATLRLGSFQMPRAANGNIFDADTRHARGDNVELTVLAPVTGTTVRLLAYENHARMGSYAEAIAIARATASVPNVVADDRPGRAKRGWGLNAEQPLADIGETGLFARLGASDGRNEDFAFTEVDRHASVGAQLSGVHWGRAADRVALGAVRHDISTLHREYLAAGGKGFLLGDGALRYGSEDIVEGYYRVQANPFIEVTPDVQRVVNPGYNRDRGPATVVSLRINLRY
ncbi:MAG: carbohydrate porin [Gemmatimonadaceae bacterium]|nr:carbohydrate porin [Gemmatimonadaceae bacterium]